MSVYRLMGPSEKIHLCLRVSSGDAIELRSKQSILNPFIGFDRWERKLEYCAVR